MLGHRLRVEHYDNAQNQGVHAAKSDARQRGAVRAGPVLLVGPVRADAPVPRPRHRRRRDGLRGDVEQRTFTAFYLREGAVRAALGINRLREVNATKRLIRDRVPVSREQLADEGLDLRRVGKP